MSASPRVETEASRPGAPDGSKVGRRSLRRARGAVCAALVGAAAVLGWLAAGLAGPLAARAVVTAAGATVAVELCQRRPRRGVVAGLAAALAATAAVFLGGGSLLLAWPVAGLVCGLAAARIPPRARADVALVLLTPALASVAFVLGAVVVAASGFTLDDARLLDQAFLGGAAGFGVFLGAFVPWVGSRLPAPGVTTPAVR